MWAYHGYEAYEFVFVLLPLGVKWIKVIITVFFQCMQLKILAVDLEMTACSQSRTVKSFAKRQANNFLGVFLYTS